MNDNNKNKARTLTSYAAFGVALAFMVTVLGWWILQNVIPKIPGAIMIGILVALAIKLFKDAMGREEDKGS